MSWRSFKLTSLAGHRYNAIASVFEPECYVGTVAARVRDELEKKYRAWAVPRSIS
jgi:hypothetical protein